MTEQELIAFLTANLTINSVNAVGPYDDSDNFTVQIVLKGTVIGETVLNINNGTK
jgi:hypothetical protein